ncbi:tautomerase family protein [Pediococcus claussenii]|uniref:Malonate semialdehyde decarboxylase n=1 Tax=Pediococcus claussenii (strain ATCC BAA-344 / DSM 14800 / JCM 18046 / KCTC 3811 / LMG 21948 / P06) TaxID=701521 RepID=G8PEG9_PEDCP|nr:tautomerase family protein [Pediococcus claussenii]AEV95578.1 malonate semialdehyde decarboxylase [Pediococcus claussenii ATCC BAA-344]ANZ69098.1 tautomerase [Pediococcus claussenii]ANZ70915.1 tautomerase [Pediococcus claussenii]KRN20189.1 msaD protein [Pediococcus claussenii]
MPLMKIDMLKGRSEDEIKKILDISYQVMLDAFGAPVGDRYQVVNQHEAYEMQILDTGLGFERTDQVLVFSLTTRPRTREQKKKFYANLVSKLHEKTGIRPEDVMINLTVNSDEDWSFGMGKAQFLTGDL